MTKKTLNLTWKLRATGALVLALALSTFPMAFSRAVNAQTPAKTTAQTPAKTTASPATESNGGQKEGIKVHGHWTIDVRNPDGTLVTHREFDNALADGGVVLSQILGRRSKPDLWQIFLVVSGSSPWPNRVVGEIVEPDGPEPSGGNVSKNLSLCVGGSPCTIAGVPQPPSPVGTFLLGGNIPALQIGTIGNVETILFYCAPDFQGHCNSYYAFTAHPLAPLVNGLCPLNTQCVVNVVAGQIIQVTVVISFS